MTTPDSTPHSKHAASISEHLATLRAALGVAVEHPSISLALSGIEEQLEAVQRWFTTEPWKGSADGSSFGCGDYTPKERAIGYGSYRDPRFLPPLLKAASTPARRP